MGSLSPPKAFKRWGEMAKRRMDSRRSVEERNNLVTTNMGLIGVAMNKLVNQMTVYSVIRNNDDARQEAFLALIRAAELWDETKGFKFSTYAVQCIVNTLLRSPAIQPIVPIPARFRYRYREELKHKDGRSFGKCVSLDLSDLPSHYFVVREEDLYPGREKINGTLFEEIVKYIPKLPEDLQRYYRCRYEKGMGAKEIAEEMNLTKVRLRTLRDRFLVRFRYILSLNGLFSSNS